MQISRGWSDAGAALALLALSGCYLTHDVDGLGGSEDGHASTSAAPRGRGGSPRSPGTGGSPASVAMPPRPDRIDDLTDFAAPLGPIGCAPTTPPEIDKADLLFMVDNSGSMSQEQAALRREFPKIVRVLTTGDTDGDGIQDFPPARDLHLGVVSSDMGLSGIHDIDKCEGLGDDGLLQHTPNLTLDGCQASYPPFLSYRSGVDDPEQTARDFACIATLGTEGCGFEQQLESALKALWPRIDVDPSSGRAFQPNRIRFLGDVSGFGQTGHGDAENSGFLRNDPAQGLSLIALIMVTDEEDCSSADTTHFTPGFQLAPDDPLFNQGLNVRCFFNKQNLFPIERYVRGFRALRPGNEALVMFAVIAGVPEDLVGSDAVDYENADSRELFYRRILDDARMQEVIDPSPMPGADSLIPSCKTANGIAYPPRRLVSVAREFGENGLVQSICGGDFGAATDALLARLGSRLSDPCLRE